MPLAGSLASLTAELFAQAAPGPGQGCWQFLPAALGIMGLFYFFFLRPQQKERKQREEMIGGLKKNDRVVTIGGIHGVVTNVSPDGNEVTLRVEDNTKIRFSKSAIHEVRTDGKTEGAKDSPGDSAK